MEVRLIIVSSEDGEDETVWFIEAEYEDGEALASAFCKPGQTVDVDRVLELALPDTFPFGRPLQRQ